MPVRFGGEEFVVALPGLGLAAARTVAGEVLDRLRAHAGARNPDDREHWHAPGRPVAATRIDTGPGRTDAALYRAKNEGRDCPRTTHPVPDRVWRPRSVGAPRPHGLEHDAVAHERNRGRYFGIERTIALEERDACADRRVCRGDVMTRPELG